MPDEHLMKISVIGIPDKLKMTMVRTFAEEGMSGADPQSLGVDISTIQIQVNGNYPPVKLIIVVNISSEFYRRNSTSYYRGASAAIITFAKEDRVSFKAVKDWYKEFKRYIPESSVPIALVGFITESETVTTEEGQNLADELKVLYYESKLTDGKTIETIFHDLVINVLRKKGWEE